MADIRHNRISIVLDELNTSQKDLAEMLKVKKDTVSRWCRNINQPSLKQLYKIAQLFRIDTRELVQPPDWSKEVGPTPSEEHKKRKEEAKQEAKLKSKKKRVPGSIRKPRKSK